MTDILYMIIIYPVTQIIGLCYLFIFRIFHNPAIALLGVSAAVSLLTLPLYFRAEEWQDAERAVQKRLAPKIAKIRAVFAGDERYMILSAHYRQNHYHPVYALRGSFGLLIQIPFFIAAYSFIGHLESLKGIPFLFIADLAKPDMLLKIRDIHFNFLPVLMTLINCISGAIYTRKLPFKDKAQVFGIAVVFLILLYNSPAGLVLYWTTNNLFSLAKNILHEKKYSKTIVYITMCVFILMLAVYILFFHSGYLLKRIAVSVILLVLPFLPYMAHIGKFIKNKYLTASLKNSSIYSYKTFFFAILSLFLLLGYVIPSALISSSVHEFSFLENYKSPFPFIGITVLQAAGIFLLWPLGIYFLFSKKVKISLSVIAVFCCTFSLFNAFLFQGNYGFFTNTMLLSNPVTLAANAQLIILNCIVLFVLIPVIFFFLVSKRCKMILLSIQIIIAVSLFGFGTISLLNINKQYHELSQQQDTGTAAEDFSPVYHLSKTSKNVIIIMLDRAISGYVPYMFSERTELAELWNGFTWYPNCASFSGWTLFGIPALSGGYEYTPLQMQENPKPLVEKHNEALLLLPRLFTDLGYNVSITDPSYSNYALTPDLNIFDSHPSIHAENISFAYTHLWLQTHPEITTLSISDLLKDRLIRFSIFKTAPAILRIFIYDRGDWLTVNDRDLKEKNNELTLNIIGEYAALDYLPNITSLDTNSAGSLVMIYNNLTHDPTFFEAPDYIPASVVTNRGKSQFANSAHYHVDIAAFLLLGKWFSWLRENNVYDNTRIIIVSDHGWNVTTDGGFKLPDGNTTEKYISLLMTKDYNADGDLRVNNEFMTQADVPLLALDNLINNPINPFSGNHLAADKQNGIFITTSSKFYPTHHGNYRFNISNDEWLYVHDNVLNESNWTSPEK